MEGNALNVEPIPLKFGSPAPNPLGAAGERNGARSGNHKKLEARTRRAERGCAPSTLELSVSDQPSKSSEAVDNMESFPLMMDVSSAAEYACTGQA